MASVTGFVAGTVYSVLFERDGFYILNFDVVESDDPQVKTTKVKAGLNGLLQLQRGVPLKFVGKWVTHPKYGRQFASSSWEPWSPDTHGVEGFLQCCIQGFKNPITARALVADYGLGTFTALTSQPAEILGKDYAGVDPETLGLAVEGWRKALAARDLGVLLEAGRFSNSDIQVVMSKFGLEAPAIVTGNPYRLMEIRGFKFEKIDSLATSLGINPKDSRRIEGAILWALQDATLQGHLYLPRGKLPGAVVDLLRGVDLNFDACMEAVESLAHQKAVVVDPEVGVYLPDFHRYERGSATFLSRMHAASDLPIDLAKFLSEYEANHSIELSELQRKAVETLLAQKVLVLTGLPGTGKTMVIRTFVSLFEQSGLSYSLMAPTGIAAKRLSHVTDKPAGTIHRLLGYDGVSWEYGPSRLYPAQAVIVDECSMVDQELLYRLLSSLSPDTVLVLVGDAAQLPSVGPGNVLRELVHCDGLPNIRLTQIFRQCEKGDIVQNSHLINQGNMPVLGDPRSDTEFKFVRISQEESILEFIVELATKLKAKDANFQVLSPKYDGVVGVDSLNEALRERLNPLQGQREWREGKLLFREGDRLMVVKNDYQLGVYNGDVGKLLRVNESSLSVRIYGATGDEEGVVEFPEEDVLGKLRLAYAVTVHKSQGSEFDTIILPIVRTQGRMLQRNLLYTAVTRARKRVWLVGDESAILKAVGNDKVMQRNTVFGAAVSLELASGVDHDHDA